MRVILSLFLFLAGVAGAAPVPQINVGQVVHDSVASGLVKILPWILIAFVISILLSLAKRSPQKATMGCAYFAGIVVLFGIVVSAAQFVREHAFVFAVLGVMLVLIVLVCALIFSGKTPADSDFLHQDKVDDVAPRGAAASAEVFDSPVSPAYIEALGRWGEDFLVHSLLIACKCDGRYFRIMRNLYIPIWGGTSEIDAILLHESGIYVFESKNVTGNVFGKMEYKKWLLYHNSEEPQRFLNPILQNSGHIKSLCKFLDIDLRKILVRSVVVFGQSAVLKSVPEGERGVYVLTADRLSLKLQGILNSHQSLYSQRRIDGWFERLAPCENVSADVREEHVRRVTRRFGKFS